MSFSSRGKKSQLHSIRAFQLGEEGWQRRALKFGEVSKRAHGSRVTDMKSSTSEYLPGSPPARETEESVAQTARSLDRG